MDFDRTAFADGINFFVRLALEIHPVAITIQQVRDVPNQFRLARRNLGPFADDGDVEVAQREAASVHPAGRFADELGRISSFVSRIGVGKQFADIGLAQRAQDRIRDRVVDRIAIGVADRTQRMVEPHAPQHKRPAWSIRGQRLQTMKVITVADAIGRLRGIGHAHTLPAPPGVLIVVGAAALRAVDTPGQASGVGSARELGWLLAAP